ncbi:hypothetical protein EJ05DRAFT_215907 [Pseudovirgaria hyperparasitica]|uniref:Uncharacterized protein n=1 Tax=Pseudovirgaria hyperparasitica TaxID=470096 RepID=A0A6A6VUJ2_9PEZI|nr:uncharacterized protein EJ05DRAFT_215907 [Pseudovirgaria hyperparasitica]KAF2753456.1 hypothetical protein EJ05DRAFT_215907 [Pseudovirgaria hyperparasitica]
MNLYLPLSCVQDSHIADTKLSKLPSISSHSLRPTPHGCSSIYSPNSGQISSNETSSPPKPDEAKIERVKMLGQEDFHTLYSGAPHFTVGRWYTRPLPQVTFPWNKGVQVQDLRDCTPPAHAAFSLATSRRHTHKMDTEDEEDKVHIGYEISIEEVPSMLSVTGLEPGTIGYEHFLEIPISDNYVDIDEYKASGGLSEAKRNIELLLHNPERLGIRSMQSQDINERLIELSEMYQTLKAKGGNATILDEQTPATLYTVLFGKFLTPPRYDPNTRDPTGLKVQIETLIKVLKLKGVWFDFSLVEWRIKLGQLIWASGNAQGSTEDVNSTDKAHEWTDRDTFVLQLSLACELLLRLDAVSAMSSPEVVQKMALTQAEVESFTKIKTRKTDWDLLLARRFLDDIHVMLEMPQLPVSPKKRGFFSAISSEPESPQAEQRPILVFAPRHPSRQFSGLLFFANQLLWPNMDHISSDLSRKLGLPKQDEHAKVGDPRKAVNPVIATLGTSSSSIYSTPVATPRALLNNRNSYFNIAPVRPSLSRGNSALSIQLRPSNQTDEALGNPIDIGGWLSRAYLTGFVLPGEALPHLLISTLLENDSSAITALGDAANLYGAFIYAGSSWWSKSCVAGRVLAAAEGSKECMGWIRALIVPEGFEDRWLDITFKDVDVPDRLGDAVQKSGGFIKNGDIKDAHSDDFTLPLDDDANSAYRGAIKFLELRLETATEMQNSLHASSNPQHPAVPSADHYEAKEYGVSLRFSFTPAEVYDTASVSTPDSDINHDLDDRDASPPIPHTMEFTVYITFDVHFISAFPCIPPSASKISVLLPNSTPPPSKIKGQIHAHPLHSSHSFQIVPASALYHNNPVPKDDILVVQCQSSDEQVLSRAWCAQTGHHALISRQGRTCLSCAIREAGALGVKVVIRMIKA